MKTLRQNNEEDSNFIISLPYYGIAVIVLLAILTN